MGKEIRRVPKDWKHPMDENGRYKPLRDLSYEVASYEWLKDCIEWNNNTSDWLKDDKELKKEYPFYWDFDPTPEKEYYRPNWSENEMTHYQIYENITEGTPISPIFETLHDLENWLLQTTGSSKKTVKAFIQHGFCFTFAFRNGSLLKGIDTLKLL